MSYQTWQRDYASDPVHRGQHVHPEYLSRYDPGHHASWILRRSHDGYSAGFLYTDVDGASSWDLLIPQAFCIGAERTGFICWEE